MRASTAAVVALLATVSQAKPVGPSKVNTYQFASVTLDPKVVPEEPTAAGQASSTSASAATVSTDSTTSHKGVAGVPLAKGTAAAVPVADGKVTLTVGKKTGTLTKVPGALKTVESAKIINSLEQIEKSSKPKGQDGARMPLHAPSVERAIRAAVEDDGEPPEHKGCPICGCVPPAVCHCVVPTTSWTPPTTTWAQPPPATLTPCPESTTWAPPPPPATTSCPPGWNTTVHPAPPSSTHIHNGTHVPVIGGAFRNAAASVSGLVMLAVGTVFLL